MGTQILLTIPDDLYQHAKRVAKSRQQDVTQLLTESIVLPPEVEETDEFVSSISDEDFERERAAFLNMHTQLAQEYLGQYAAIYQGELIDHDIDLANLMDRVDEKYPDTFVLVRQVEVNPERTYYLRSPRFAR
jgi:hypothetical protein